MILAQVSWIVVIDVIIGAFLLWILGVQGYTYFLGRKNAKFLTNEEFKAGMRRAQIVDVREPATFKRAHILGARNVPYSQLKLYNNALRKDLPVYLYDQGRSISIRTAAKLRKQGYSEIFILKAGFDRWDGKKKGTKFE